MKDSHHKTRFGELSADPMVIAGDFRIGRYEATSVLGGGMSRVYKAWDPLLRRWVAVKVLLTEMSDDPDTRARFVREVQTVAGLSHDNIVQIYDYGEERGQPYLVMEFIEGASLDCVIRDRRSIDVRVNLDFALQLARAMEYVHAHGVVHRDIKPQNVHIERSGRLRLIDFGIAKPDASALTRPGCTLGTTSYMAPEQILGTSVTQATDAFAFGVLLYELSTGIKPFVGETVETIFAQILGVDFDAEPLCRQQVPTTLLALIRACLDKERACSVNFSNTVRHPGDQYHFVHKAPLLRG